VSSSSQSRTTLANITASTSSLLVPRIAALQLTSCAPSSAIAIALDLIIWFTHSIPANAVCFALIGFVLGPMYPIVMMAIIDVLPGELQAGCIGWVASLGQAGSAIMPL